jgi:hypothetical protein
MAGCRQKLMGCWKVKNIISPLQLSIVTAKAIIQMRWSTWYNFSLGKIWGHHIDFWLLSFAIIPKALASIIIVSPFFC